MIDKKKNTHRGSEGLRFIRKKCIECSNISSDGMTFQSTSHIPQHLLYAIVMEMATVGSSKLNKIH